MKQITGMTNRGWYGKVLTPMNAVTYINNCNTNLQSLMSNPNKTALSDMEAEPLCIPNYSLELHYSRKAPQRGTSPGSSCLGQLSNKAPKQASVSKAFCLKTFYVDFFFFYFLYCSLCSTYISSHGPVVLTNKLF